MIHINEILAYKHIIDYYYTDGIDVYHKITKEKNAKNYRIKINGKSQCINHLNIDYINNLSNRYYVFDGDILFRKIKWHEDKNGYYFLMTDTRNNPQKISQHRLIYFYNNNIKPPEKYVIDHIDRNKKNNQLNNLRFVTYSVNSNNIDKENRRYKSSKYYYRCIDINTNQVICEGLANDICSLIKIDNGLINRYAKKGYIYKNTYKIEIIGERR